jgi:hypothetical protein
MSATTPRFQFLRRGLFCCLLALVFLHQTIGQAAHRDPTQDPTTPERRAIEAIYSAFRKDIISLPYDNEQKAKEILHEVAFEKRRQIGTTSVSSDAAALALIRFHDEIAMQKYCRTGSMLKASPCHSIFLVSPNNPC